MDEHYEKYMMWSELYSKATIRLTLADDTKNLGILNSIKFACDRIVNSELSKDEKLSTLKEMRTIYDGLIWPQSNYGIVGGVYYIDMCIEWQLYADSYLPDAVRRILSQYKD